MASPRRCKRPVSRLCRSDSCSPHHSLDVAQPGRVPGSGPGSAGSNPAIETTHLDVAQPGRALRLGRRSRRFNSCHPDHMARRQQAQVSCMPDKLREGRRGQNHASLSISHVDVGATVSTPVCESGNLGSTPKRPPTLRDTSIGRRPGSEPGSWRFDSSSLNHLLMSDNGQSPGLSTQKSWVRFPA